ncbi:MAG: hypothetical protein LC808_25955 [Actinobacteria bacterium]|nr:hypothetical protein [Actinomycetota bacterium]
MTTPDGHEVELPVTRFERDAAAPGDLERPGASDRIERAGIRYVPPPQEPKQETTKALPDFGL